MLKLKPRKTVEDYMNLPEGTLAELIGGELFMTPSPLQQHQYIVGEVFATIRESARRTGSGEIYMAPLDVHLPSGDIVEPDLVFVSTPNRGIIKDWIRGVPNLVVEVISADRPERDRLAKRELYARNGVPEYWIVDPGTRSVEVYRVEGSTYPQPALFEAGDTLTSVLLPEFSLRVESIFPAT